MTPLGITFSTDEQMVAQGDVSFMEKNDRVTRCGIRPGKVQRVFLFWLQEPQGSTAVPQGLLRDPLSSLFGDFPKDYLHKLGYFWPRRAWPVSTFPTRPVRPTLLKANLALSLLSTFLSSRLPGSPTTREA